MSRHARRFRRRILVAFRRELVAYAREIGKPIGTLSADEIDICRGRLAARMERNGGEQRP